MKTGAEWLPGRGAGVIYTALATVPGNTFLPSAVTRLPRDSVVNVTALVTLNKNDLSNWIGSTPLSLLRDVDRGLRLVLGL